MSSVWTNKKKYIQLNEVSVEEFNQQLTEALSSMTQQEKKELVDVLVDAVANVRSSVEEGGVSNSERNKILNTQFEVIPQY